MFRFHGFGVFVPLNYYLHKCPKQHQDDVLIVAFSEWLEGIWNQHNFLNVRIGSFALDFFGSRECTRAAPSMIFASTIGAMSWKGVNDSKHFIRSDLQVECIIPLDAKDGGHG